MTTLELEGKYVVGTGAPIDWGWELAPTLAEVLAKLADDPYEEYLTKKLWEMKALLPRDDITEGPVVVWVPSPPDFDPLLVVKEYDNGTVTIVGDTVNASLMTEMGFAPTHEMFMEHLNRTMIVK
jgi:hypothetical protein